jgi:hypothetical protein
MYYQLAHAALCGSRALEEPTFASLYATVITASVFARADELIIYSIDAHVILFDLLVEWEGPR